jgi:hypothetical protein
MEFVERATKLVELESHYYEELEEHGIDNLRFESQYKSDKPGFH